MDYDKFVDIRGSTLESNNL